MKAKNLPLSIVLIILPFGRIKPFTPLFSRNEADSSITASIFFRFREEIGFGSTINSFLSNNIVSRIILLKNNTNRKINT